MQVRARAIHVGAPLCKHEVISIMSPEAITDVLVMRGSVPKSTLPA